ncbi:hypothetical protein GCM10010123_37540 [Pilimelia anulata]|uniref:Uncharacterized protein n=1 Tax=Pilimelia anulata TaxID=53371 RepID=A0A8J3FC27_9ACTN|nr:hypothetical protein GCM10010123_37540 [Pilimelia anulata]
MSTGLTGDTGLTGKRRAYRRHGERRADRECRAQGTERARTDLMTVRGTTSCRGSAGSSEVSFDHHGPQE